MNLKGQERLEAFNQRLERAANAAIAAANDDLSDVVNEVLIEAQNRAPVKTGALRDSLHAVWSGPLRVRIESTAAYARYVELGTRPHTIRPRLKKALAFTASDGTRVVVRKVEHPGTKPQPFLRPAIEAVLKRRNRRDNPAISALVDR